MRGEPDPLPAAPSVTGDQLGLGLVLSCALGEKDGTATRVGRFVFSVFQAALAL